MNYTHIFDQKFALVDREIDLLRDKVFRKSGGWIFTTHRYSKEELWESAHFDRIESICEKIGDDAVRWRQQGSLPDDGIHVYQRARDRIARQLRALRRDIQNREPTAIEWLLELFEGVARTLLRVLPTAAALFRILRPFLPAPLRKLALPSGSK